MFLQCEEQKLAASHDKWDENKEAQNLKEMELSGSGLGSSVIQKYWKAVLESYVDADIQLRRAAVQVCSGRKVVVCSLDSTESNGFYSIHITRNSVVCKLKFSVI